VQVRGAGIERPETMAADRIAVQEMVRAGVVRPAIAKRYALADYAEAMNAAYGGKEAGRIVLLME
jgi:NADPH2:quinone reductase